MILENGDGEGDRGRVCGLRLWILGHNKEEMIMELKLVTMENGSEMQRRRWRVKVVAGNEFNCEWKFPNMLEKIPWVQ